MRKFCIHSVFSSALYACIPYFLVLYMQCHITRWAVRQPAEHVPIVSLPDGDGLVFMTSWAVEAQPEGGEPRGTLEPARLHLLSHLNPLGR